ncbi:hypothetical protein O3P69_006576 [Scylla paramamosain]|uniref:Uncharacterized protein n=1 Tax=Scylla paramamosain TaxID=85552 RepID=A0AAW0U345_SCYPA
MRKRKKRVKEEDGINCEDCERRFHSGCQNESSKEELWRKIEDVLPDPNPPIAPLEKSQNSDELDQRLNDDGNFDEGDEATARAMGIQDDVWLVMLRSSKEELWRKIEDVLPDPNPPIAPLEKSQNSDKLDQHIVNDHGNLDEGDEATAHVMDIHDEFYQVMPRLAQQQ